jgi:membrane protease subunit HflK
MSLNDPQWGKRGKNGPPDLDELWQNFNRRLGGLLGRRGTPSGDENGERPGLPVGGLGALIALVILVWAASGFYIVDEGWRGIVLRFGKYRETTLPGPRWHLPFPIESVEKVNLSGVKTVEVGYRSNVRSKVLKESLMLTDDENIIDLQFAVQYILSDPTKYLFNNRATDETVLQVAETAIREVVGKSAMDFVLYEGRDKIAAQTRDLMQQILDRYGTGVQISKVTMQNAQPPEQVQAAFDDAVKASQDRERQKNEGQAYANDIVPKARGAAARLLEEATGYASAVVSKAEGDASRFRQILVEYNRAPAVMRDRLYLEMMQQVLGSTSKVLVDQKSGGSNIMYLPLDRLLRGADQGSAPAAADSSRTAPAEPSISVEPPRSREALRNREGR